VAEVEQRKSNEMIGAELGYRYDGSPLIVPDAGEPPPLDFLRYHPSTWPGAISRSRVSTFDRQML
jgi:hypothetical protein